MINSILSVLLEELTDEECLEEGSLMTESLEGKALRKIKSLNDLNLQKVESLDDLISEYEEIEEHDCTEVTSLEGQSLEGQSLEGVGLEGKNLNRKEQPESLEGVSKMNYTLEGEHEHPYKLEKKPIQDNYSLKKQKSIGILESLDLKDKNNIKKGLILSEILGKPKSLR